MRSTWDEKLSEDLEVAPERLKELIKVIARLREPGNGCPWDLKQTHRTLRKYMIEEAYEAVEAMGIDDIDHLTEELGDVLLQVVLNAQLLRDSDQASISDIIQGITEKMIRRHPHVFSDVTAESAEDVLNNWAQIKESEKGIQAQQGIFDSLEVGCLPGMLQAVKIGKRANEINFDWSNSIEVFRQVESELEELMAEIQVGDGERIEDEMGDVLFSLAQLCRHLNVDPEVAVMRGNQKFKTRFRMMESECSSRNEDIRSLGRSQLESLWKLAKKKSLLDE